MQLSKSEYNNLENVGVILADDICSIRNKNIQFTTDLTSDNVNLSMDYYGFLNQNAHIAQLLHLKFNQNVIDYHNQAINQLQLLKLIEQLVGEIVLDKHSAKMPVKTKSLSLF